MCVCVRFFNEMGRSFCPIKEEILTINWKKRTFCDF